MAQDGVDEPGRVADIYVFAWHPETDEKLVDQRNPNQWTFYVLRTEELPPQQKSIGLAGVEALTPLVRAQSLADVVLRLTSTELKRTAARHKSAQERRSGRAHGSSY